MRNNNRITTPFMMSVCRRVFAFPLTPNNLSNQYPICGLRPEYSGSYPRFSTYTALKGAILAYFLDFKWNGKMEMTPAAEPGSEVN